MRLSFRRLAGFIFWVGGILAASVAMGQSSDSLPDNTFATAGDRVVLAPTVTGAATLIYQWYRNTTPIPGATNSTLVFDPVVTGDSDAYRVDMTNGGVTVTSYTALLVRPVPRISNLSVLTELVDADDSFQLGFVVSGASGAVTKPLAVRAVGPSLTGFGVASPLSDPRLRVISGGVVQTENDDWGGAASLAAVFAQVGAFSLTTPASKDAGAALSISTRDNTVTVSSSNRGTGSVLAEIYDATPGSSFSTRSPRLINVSVRKRLGAGFTVGFTLAEGFAPRRVLIRAVGPTLASFGVTDALPNPNLTLYDGSSHVVAQVDDWDARFLNVTQAFDAVGAFPLPANSKDAAYVGYLAPGNYTVKVGGEPGTNGTVLVEVYEVP